MTSILREVIQVTALERAIPIAAFVALGNTEQEKHEIVMLVTQLRAPNRVLPR
jgi:hypothetical protein